MLALVIGGALISLEGVAMQTKANGWITFPECGQAGINILNRPCVPPFSPPPTVYWQTALDGAGHRLNGQHDYLSFRTGLTGLLFYEVLFISLVVVVIGARRCYRVIRDMFQKSKGLSHEGQGDWLQLVTILAAAFGIGGPGGI